MAAFKRRQIEAEDRQNRPTTLGDLAARELEVFWWCHRCGDHATLSTASLLLRLGPAHPVPEIGMALRCPGCGAHDVATRPDWRGTSLVSR